ncbi:DNA ligase D [Variovorax sp. PAMC 28711]|uniref:DNA ligase D n=1 Tax=Variovorax sp. PAMC 28711 TaxID=1795631 RepID=UPI00078D4DD6|nr:DNA ligase D [Variovorax sp. PAMC 28711]AMM25401.1 ATP-dependent DNA ligase [Variovorax sp. PAMC 28711]
MAKDDALKTYKAKRNFKITSEPEEGGEAGAEGQRQFVIQKHWATRLHYDLRLELDGTMKSWAVPKGPSFDPSDKRMAVQVEDHPISYNSFEGQIPAKQYGAGKVIVWDKGTWAPIGDAQKGYRDGKLKFELHGHKLRGHWTLVRMKGKDRDDAKQPPWLLIKEHDDFERPATEYSVVDALPDSVGKRPMPGAKGARKPAAKKSAAKPAGKVALPATLKPQLATLVDAPPADPDAWLYEIKFDGYRLLARIDGSKVQLFTRNGHDWTHKLGNLAAALQKAKLPPCWLDGEIVVNNAAGVPDFQALQNAFDKSGTDAIVYFVFDLPFCEGQDLREAPLGARRARLQTLLQDVDSDTVRFSAVFDAPGRDIVLSACELGLEGVIGKRKDSVYRASRSPDWIKLKCSQRQEFVIGGWTDPKGARAGLGALLLGVHDERGALRYAGNVGSGFSAASLTALRQQLDKIAAKKSPFSAKTAIDRSAHWVAPKLIAEISFSEWTKTGSVRHPVFHGLRADKPPVQIVRERPVDAGSSAKASKAAPKPALASVLPASFKVSSPTRVIDATTGATKIDVVRYYALIAPLLLPHLKGRPVSLVRAPEGIGGELFFQKHLDKYKMPGVRPLDPALDPGHAPLLEIATAQGLLSAAQMNALEFHTWNAVKTAIGKPDRMTFDLDPGEGVAWSTMQQAAKLVHVLLKELELAAFVKTSGGKGLHVVVPLQKRDDWDTVKAFSQAIVQHLARTLPQVFVAKSGPRNRVGKIFADYLRNGFGATTASAWTLRARPGLGVSVPIAWDEVDHIDSGAHWKLADIHRRLDTGNAPWDGFAEAARSPREAMAALDFTP